MKRLITVVISAALLAAIGADAQPPSGRDVDVDAPERLDAQGRIGLGTVGVGAIVGIVAFVGGFIVGGALGFRSGFRRRVAAIESAPDWTLGRVIYEALWRNASSTLFPGVETQPDWKSLPNFAQEGWNRTGETVREALETGSWEPE